MSAHRGLIATTGPWRLVFWKVQKDSKEVLLCWAQNQIVHNHIFIFYVGLKYNPQGYTSICPISRSSLLLTTQNTNSDFHLLTLWLKFLVITVEIYHEDIIENLQTYDTYDAGMPRWDVQYVLHEQKYSALDKFKLMFE